MDHLEFVLPTVFYDIDKSIYIVHIMSIHSSYSPLITTSSKPLYYFKMHVLRHLLFVILSFFFWPLCFLSSFSFGHCAVCPSLFLLTIVLSVLLFFFWPLCCLSFSFSFDHCVVCPSLFLLTIVLSVLRFTGSNYSFRIFKTLLGIYFYYYQWVKSSGGGLWAYMKKVFPETRRTQ